MLTLDDVARYVGRYFWRKTDLIVARAGIRYGTGADTMSTYTEDTYSPVITCAAGTITTLTYTTQTGQYTQIGNVVFYKATIVVDTFTIGTGSGDLRVSLPLTAPNASYAQVPGAVTLSGLNLQANTCNVTFRPVQNTAYGILRETQDDGALVTTAIGALASGDTVSVAGFYYTR